MMKHLKRRRVEWEKRARLVDHWRCTECKRNVFTFPSGPGAEPGPAPDCEWCRFLAESKEKRNETH